MQHAALNQLRSILDLQCSLAGCWLGRLLAVVTSTTLQQSSVCQPGPIITYTERERERERGGEREGGRAPVHSFLHLSRNPWVLDHCNEEQQQEEHRMQQDNSVDAGKDTPERMHLACQSATVAGDYPALKKCYRQTWQVEISYFVVSKSIYYSFGPE